MRKILVISPSGRFYGSEQVLYDYLSESSLQLNVFVPSTGLLISRLQYLKHKHRIRSFNTSFISFFYAKVFYFLFIGKYSTVYCNEAGHVKYINLLAKIFKNKRFYLHVRINEDTDKARWGNYNSKNLFALVVSSYIQKQLVYPSILLYDPYKFLPKQEINSSQKNNFKIGIIGRISLNKGLNILIELLDYLKENKINYEFLLFGEIDKELINKFSEKLNDYSSVHLMGFVADKNSIYNSVDCVLHLSKTEPLGRIFLEAIDYNLPFVGFNEGGIGEIGKMTGLTDLLINEKGINTSHEIFEKLRIINADQAFFISKTNAAKTNAEKLFNLCHYTKQLDLYFS